MTTERELCFERDGKRIYGTLYIEEAGEKMPVLILCHGYGGDARGTEYREGIFVGYRYYDKKKAEVLFPFGHGLSYTTFEFSGLKLSAESVRDTDGLTVTATVKNTGSRAGKAVAQLYVGAVDSDVVRPVRELKAFSKVALAPGESKEVSFTLDKRAFAYWKQEIHDWYAESGEYTIEVGDSSASLPLKASVRVESTTRLPRHYDRDSIPLDIRKDPKAWAALLAYRKEKRVEKERSAAEDEAFGDMNEIMDAYSPLRGMISFGGAVSEDEITELVRKLNE